VTILSEVPPHALDDRIELFLATVPQLLEDLTDAVFEDHRSTLIKKKLAAPKTLGEESQLFWSEISGGTRDFHRDAKAADALRSLSKADLASFWLETFAADSQQRRKLLACVYSPDMALPSPSSLVSAVSTTPIVCVDGLDAVLEYKRTLAAFPGPHLRAA